MSYFTGCSAYDSARGCKCTSCEHAAIEREMRKLHHFLAGREHNAMLSDDSAAPQDRKADLSNRTLVEERPQGMECSRQLDSRRKAQLQEGKMITR